MTTYVAKGIGTKIFKDKAAKRFKQDDPYYDKVETRKWCGLRKGFKKVKKAPPPGLTEAEAKVLQKFKDRARTLDRCFFNQFGISAVIGLIPVAGDAIDGAMAVAIMQAAKHDLDKEGTQIRRSTWNKMRANIVLDIGVGLIPVLGDVADAFFKCNTRNAVLLEKALRKVAAHRTGVVEPSRVEELSDSDSYSDREHRPEMRQARDRRESTDRRNKPLPAPARDDRRIEHDGDLRRDDDYRRSKRERVPDRHNGSRREEGGHAPSRQGSRLQRRERPQR